MNKSGMQLMEWTPELGQRAETQLDVVVQPSDLGFGNLSFVIRPAGVYSKLGKAGLVAHGERYSLLAPLIRNSDAFKEGTVDAMTEPANASPPDDRAIAWPRLGERRLAWKPTPLAGHRHRATRRKGVAGGLSDRARDGPLIH